METIVEIKKYRQSISLHIEPHEKLSIKYACKLTLFLGWPYLVCLERTIPIEYNLSQNGRTLSGY